MGGELWRVGNDGTGLQAFTTDCMARSCEPILWTPDGRVVRKVYDPMTGAYVYDVVDPATGMTALLPIPAGATLADWR